MYIQKKYESNKDQKENPNDDINSSQNMMGYSLPAGRYQKSPLGNSKEMGEYPDEMLYLDPSEVNPLQRSINQNEKDSKANTKGGKVVFSLKDNSRVRTIKNPRLEARMERVSRSPKTINVGESAKEVEYNIKSMMHRKTENKLMDSYQNTQQSGQETGNIFLDKPLQGFLQEENVNQSGSFHYPSPSPPGKGRGEIDYSNNMRDMQYSLKPRDVRDPVNMASKMSPDKNIGDESGSDFKQPDTSQQLRELKNQMDRNSSPDNSGMERVSRPYRGSSPNMMNEYNRSSQQVISENQHDLKRLIQKIKKDYEPDAQMGNVLIGTSQTIPLGRNDFFGDRYSVLQKMNRLSTILLSKQKPRNASNEPVDLNKSMRGEKFNRKTLNASIAKGRKQPDKTPHTKFLYLSLAMLSSKGLHCEDRIILRKMRLDKGGVVDLAQEIAKDEKYKVKKMQRKTLASKGNQIKYNPKYRDKAARIIQDWWKSLKEKYTQILDKIILIQSVWRGKWLRKYIYEIIYLSFLNQRFCDIILKILRKKAREYVWDQLFSRQKLFKNLMGNILSKYDEKFSALRIKPYFEKWRNANENQKLRSVRFRKAFNNKDQKMKELENLKNRFKIWEFKTKMAKFLENSKNTEADKKKLMATLNLTNGLNNLARREVLRSSQPKIKDYLTKNLKNKLLTRIVNRKPQHELRLRAKPAVDKWKENKDKMVIRDLKSDIFKNYLMHIINGKDRQNLQSAFLKWKKPGSNQKILERILRGCRPLENYVHRNTYRDPLDAIKDKINYLNEKNGILRMLGVKTRYIKHNWGEYFVLWRIQAQKIANKLEKDKIYSRLFNTILKKLKYRVLANKFATWRKQPKLDLDKLFKRYKDMNDMIKKTVNVCIKPDKEKFLSRAKNTKSAPTKLRSVNKLKHACNSMDKRKLRDKLYKWRDQCSNMEIWNLKTEILKYMCGLNDSRNRRNRLARAFRIWNVMARAEKNKDDLIMLGKIIAGLELLEKGRNKNLRFAFRKILRKSIKDVRPIFLKRLFRKLNGPVSTTLNCLDRWRRINDKIKSNAGINRFKAKIIQISLKKFADRYERDQLLNGFYKWKANARQDEKFYPNITEGLEHLKKGATLRACRKPFEKIKGSKNYGKLLRSVKKVGDNFEKRDKNELLRQKFGQWRNSKALVAMNELKGILIYRMKALFESNAVNKIKAKYFNKWSRTPANKPSLAFLKGVEKLENFTWRRNEDDVIDAFKDQNVNTNKLRAAKKFKKEADDCDRKALSKYFHIFFMKAFQVDPLREKKIKSKMTRIVAKYNRVPLQSFMDRWYRILTLHPDFEKIVKGSEKLKTGLIKMNKKFFNRLKSYISIIAFRNCLRQRILPQTEKALKRNLKKAFDRYRNNVNRERIYLLKTAVIAGYYGKYRDTYRKTILRNKLHQWQCNKPRMVIYFPPPIVYYTNSELSHGMPSNPGYPVNPVSCPYPGMNQGALDPAYINGVKPNPMYPNYPNNP